MREPRRLHRAAIAVYALHAIGSAAVPILVLVGLTLLGGPLDTRELTRSLIYGALGLAFAVGSGYVRWLTTTYAVDAQAMHHHSGIVRKEDTDVPLARIEALDVRQGPTQRLFGVQAVHVQTGGGSRGGEIELPAVSVADVRELRALVGRARRGAGEPAADPQAPAAPFRRLGRRDLLLSALTSPQLGIVLPVLAAGANISQQVLQEEGRHRAESLIPHHASGWVLAVAALLAAAWLLSMLGTVIAFARFTVIRDGDRLRIQRGLIARREATVPVARIRAVRVVESALRMPLGLALLRIEVSGYAREGSAARTLFPLVRMGDVQGLLAELLPELADAPGGLSRPPRRAARRYFTLPMSVGAGLALAAWWFIGPWSLLFLLAALAYGWLRWRAAGWRLQDGRIAIRSLGVAWTTVLAPAHYRESHTLIQSWFQARARLASLEVEFGKRTSARIDYLELDDARAAWAALR